MPAVDMYTEVLAGCDETCRWMSAANLAAAIFVGDRTTASTLLHGWRGKVTDTNSSGLST